MKITEVSSTNRKFTVGQLETCVLYTLSVAAVNKMGEGKSVSQNGKTELEGKIYQMNHIASNNNCW